MKESWPLQNDPPSPALEPVSALKLDPRRVLVAVVVLAIAVSALAPVAAAEPPGAAVAATLTAWSPGPVLAQPGGFADVAEDAYYAVPVASLAERGVFVGTECEDGFCPGDPLDRKTMAVWVVRVLDGEDPPAVTQTRFSDVDAESFHGAFVERMAELGVTAGCSDTMFCPDRTVARAQMAVFLSQAYELPDGADPGFSDVPDGAWYAADMARLAASGITAGCATDRFCPDLDTRRAQMATFLYHAENLPDTAETAIEYRAGDTIAGFPSGFSAASGNFNRASVSITGGGGTVTITMSHNGTAAYTATTYTCTSVGGCTILNGRVTTGTVNATATDETNRPPRFTSPATLTAPENSTAAGTVTAIDDDTADTVTGYAITGGADRSRLSITNTGQLNFNTAPDYEHPTDTDQDNTYQITVTATSGTGTRTTTATQAITVTITEPPSAPAPDLWVFTPTVSDSSPTAGATFTLSATVHNDGSGPSASTTLRHYRSTARSISTETPVGTDTVSRLDAQESESESISLTAPATPGNYWYYACVDPVADESDTTNNCSGAVTVTVGVGEIAPDLVVDTPTVTYPTTWTRGFKLSATVRNQGNGPSAFTTLRYYRSTDATITTGDTQVSTTGVSGLNAQQSRAEPTSVNALPSPGTYYYGACVDATWESDTTNNCSGSVTVSVGAPDLVVDTPTVSDSSPTAGASFTLSVTVRNQRSGPSASTTLRYYRSTDATITTADTLANTDRVSRLGAQDSEAESTGLTAPRAAGTHYYGACVDAVAGESDTTNNCSAAVTVTVGAPDLVVDTPTVSDSSPTAGATFTLSATVHNQGDAPSASTTLHYYRSTEHSSAEHSSAHTLVGTDTVSRLDAGQRESESISLTAPSTPGTYYYDACVDATWNINFLDMGNNCSGSVTVTVGAAPAPDLVVDTPTVSDNSPTAGATFTLSATVHNRGDAPSASTMLRYYRSTDATITGADTQAGGKIVSRLGAQDSEAESISLTAPSTPGTYYYGACVDMAFGESNTQNNCSGSVQVTVSAPAGPVVGVNNLECGGEELYSGSSRIQYTVTGEVHTNRDIRQVQVGYGIGYFRDLEFGFSIYNGPIGAFSPLGSMSAGESKSFSFTWIEATRRTACTVEVVWTE